MQYCQHYDPRPRGKGCKAGMPIDKIQCVPVPGQRMKWAPCIEGHLLDDPLKYCPKWIRNTREHAEARADSVERSIAMITKASPFIKAWREKLPIGKA